jgi:hypothetical protein
MSSQFVEKQFTTATPGAVYTPGVRVGSYGNVPPGGHYVCVASGGTTTIAPPTVPWQSNDVWRWSVEAPPDGSIHITPAAGETTPGVS